MNSKIWWATKWVNAQKYWEGGGPGWSTKRHAPPVINTLPSVDISLSGCSWAVISYNESVNARKCFPEFCEPFCQVIKPEEGLMRTPTCSQLVRCTGDNLTCVWCLKWRHSCGNGVFNLWNLMLSPGVCVCACVCARMHACTRTHASHSVVSDSWTPHESCLIRATPWTVARQAPVSMEFSRQEYWSGLPFSSPR